MSRTCESMFLWLDKRLGRRNTFSKSKALENTNLLLEEEPIEEETLPHYRASNWFPVQIGLVLNERYKVLGKLGYGASSTVWFCRDKEYARHPRCLHIKLNWELTLYQSRRRRYVAVKVCCVRLSDDGKRDSRPRYEWDAYTHMSGMFSENPGHLYLRQIEDRFTVQSTATGVEHPCFVFRPAGLTLEEFHHLAPNADVALLKDIIKAMLQALDFLHTEAHIVHTDIKPDNIFFTISSPETIEIYAKRLKGRRPVGRYDAANSRTIFRSTKFTDLLQLDELSLGKPVLGDLSESRIIKTREPLPPSRTISPLQARAPEICLGLPWKYPVDIWAFAVTVWYILARRELFSLAPGESSNTKLLAQITAVLGEPPSDFFTTGRGRSPGGRSRSPLAPHGTNRAASPLASPNAANFPTNLSVSMPGAEKMDQSSLAGQLEELDYDGKTELLAFMRCMLAWRPEDRSTAASLLQHPFLAKGKGNALAAVTSVEE